MKEPKIKSEKELCRVKCVNGTSCLNYAKFGDYCWKHRQKNTQEKKGYI